MKKKIAFVCIAALLAATAFVAEAFADDDDKFRCQAIVSWNGEEMCGTDKEDCVKEAKEEAVEKACERLCKDHDACEDDCEKNAKIVAYECKDRSGNIVSSDGTLKRCENPGDKGCCKSCPKWDKPAAAAEECRKPCGKPCDQPCGGCHKKGSCKKHAK